MFGRIEDFFAGLSNFRGCAVYGAGCRAEGFGYRYVVVGVRGPRRGRLTSEVYTALLGTPIRQKSQRNPSV